jgi:hypothetical protein
MGFAYSNRRALQLPIGDVADTHIWGLSIVKGHFRQFALAAVVALSIGAMVATDAPPTAAHDTNYCGHEDVWGPYSAVLYVGYSNSGGIHSHLYDHWNYSSWGAAYSHSEWNMCGFYARSVSSTSQHPH